MSRAVGPHLHPAPDLTDAMSTATPASPSVVRNQSTRRAPPHASPADRPHRSQSTTSRPSTHSHARQQQGLNNVAARDWEQTNVANEGVRRSESRDRPAPAPARTESSRRSHARYASDASTVSAMPANGVAAAQPANTKRRTTITAPSTGTWTLGKTIGAGSMGKVKLAKHLETGEQVRTPRSRGCMPPSKRKRIRSCTTTTMLTRRRWPSRSYPGSRRTSTRAPPTVNEQTTPKKCAPPERLPLSVCSTIPTSAV